MTAAPSEIERAMASKGASFILPLSYWKLREEGHVLARVVKVIKRINTQQYTGPALSVYLDKSVLRTKSWWLPFKDCEAEIEKYAALQRREAEESAKSAEEAALRRAVAAKEAEKMKRAKKALQAKKLKLAHQAKTQKGEASVASNQKHEMQHGGQERQRKRLKARQGPKNDMLERLHALCKLQQVKNDPWLCQHEFRLLFFGAEDDTCSVGGTAHAADSAPCRKNSSQSADSSSMPVSILWARFVKWRHDQGDLAHGDGRVASDMRRRDNRQKPVAISGAADASGVDDVTSQMCSNSTSNTQEGEDVIIRPHMLSCLLQLLDADEEQRQLQKQEEGEGQHWYTNGHPYIGRIVLSSSGTEGHVVAALMDGLGTDVESATAWQVIWPGSCVPHGEQSAAADAAAEVMAAINSQMAGSGQVSGSRFGTTSSCLSVLNEKEMRLRLTDAVRAHRWGTITPASLPRWGEQGESASTSSRGDAPEEHMRGQTSRLNAQLNRAGDDKTKSDTYIETGDLLRRGVFRPLRFGNAGVSGVAGPSGAAGAASRRATVQGGRGASLRASASSEDGGRALVGQGVVVRFPVVHGSEYNLRLYAGIVHRVHGRGRNVTVDVFFRGGDYVERAITPKQLVRIGSDWGGPHHIKRITLKRSCSTCKWGIDLQFLNHGGGTVKTSSPVYLIYVMCASPTSGTVENSAAACANASSNVDLQMQKPPALRKGDFVVRIGQKAVENMLVADVIKLFAEETELDIEVARGSGYGVPNNGGSSDAAIPWQSSGHKWLGSRVKRCFEGGIEAIGTIVAWVPRDGEDPALWRVSHDDGDEEDLEEAEVADCLICKK